MSGEFERPAYRAELKRQALFAGFSDDDLDEILEAAMVRQLKAKHVLFLEGDSGSSVFIVLEGRVKVSVHSLEGREIILNVSGPGDLFGEIAMLDGGPRTASAMTLDSVKLLQLDREAIMPALERNPAAMLKILRLLCGRLRTTNQMVEEIVFHSGASRLASAILRLMEQHGAPEGDAWRLPLRLPQSALGATAGLQRESVNRQMRAWKAPAWSSPTRMGCLSCAATTWSGCRPPRTSTPIPCAWPAAVAWSSRSTEPPTGLAPAHGQAQIGPLASRRPIP